MNLTTPSAPDSHGAVVADRVSEVIWSGNSLPDEYYDEFGLSLRLPVMTDGQKLYLTVSQRSPTLGWMNWSYVPGVSGSGTEAYPAPYVTYFKNGTLTQLNLTSVQQALSSSTFTNKTSAATIMFSRAQLLTGLMATLLLI